MVAAAVVVEVALVVVVAWLVLANLVVFVALAVFGAEMFAVTGLVLVCCWCSILVSVISGADRANACNWLIALVAAAAAVTVLGTTDNNCPRVLSRLARCCWES